MPTEIETIKLILKNTAATTDSEIKDFLLNELNERLSSIRQTINIQKAENIYEEMKLISGHKNFKTVEHKYIEDVDNIIRGIAVFKVEKEFKEFLGSLCSNMYSDVINLIDFDFQLMTRYNINWEEIGFKKADIDKKISETKEYQLSKELDELTTKELVKFEELDEFLVKATVEGLDSLFDKRIKKFKKSGDQYAGLFERYQDQINGTGEKSDWCIWATISKIREAEQSVKKIHGIETATMIDNLKQVTTHRLQDNLDTLGATQWHKEDLEGQKFFHLLKMFYMDKAFYQEDGMPKVTFLGEPLTEELLNEWLETVLFYKLQVTKNFVDMSGMDLTKDLRIRCWWMKYTYETAVRFFASAAHKAQAKEGGVKDTFIGLVDYTRRNDANVFKLLGVDEYSLFMLKQGKGSFDDVFEYLLEQPALNEQWVDSFLEKQRNFFNAPAVNNNENPKENKKSWIEKIFS